MERKDVRGKLLVSGLEVVSHDLILCFAFLQVLEARHAEGKTLMSNQEKKIKRLRAEIEALQHMQEAKSREDDLDESTSDTDQVSRLGKPKKRMDADSNRPGSALSSVSMTSSTPRRAGSSFSKCGLCYRYTTGPFDAQDPSLHSAASS
jgi:hypothetical protein